MQQKTKKIKVAFFSDLLIRNFDGATRTMYNLIDRIPKDKFEYLFICGMPPKEDIGFEVFKVPTIKVPRNESYEMSFIKLFKKKLRAKIDEFKPDIIQFASPSQLSTFANKYGKANNIPIVSIYHTHFISYTKYYLSFMPIAVKPAEKLVAKMLRNAYEKVDVLYVPTDSIKQDLIERCNLSGENMKIWARGLDQEQFSPNNKKIDLVKEVTQNDKPNILFVSRLVMEKNLKLLVDLYKLSVEKGDLFNFIIIGDGVAKQKLEKEMPKAHFLGGRKHDKLATAYASCDYFVFPSISETFGNVITEAMASGIPCILANKGGHVSFSQHEKTALLCNPNSANEFYNAILRLQNEPHLKEKITQNALNFTQTLNWNDLSTEYFNDLIQLHNAN